MFLFESRMTTVRTVLECIGEDLDREGLLCTPERYAQALMWMTKAYEDCLAGSYPHFAILVPRYFFPACSQPLGHLQHPINFVRRLP
jgi:hypothetical protein